MPELRELWIVIERTGGVGEKVGNLKKGIFATQQEAEGHAKHALEANIEVAPMPDGEDIYVARWGRHFIAISERREGAEAALTSFDPRSLVHRIQYEHRENPPGIIDYDTVSLLDIEAGERQ